MKNILFCYRSPLSELGNMLGTAHLYLKTFIDIKNPNLAENLNWLQPIQHVIPDEELVEYCNKNHVDFLCTSHYIWNSTEFMEHLKNVKPFLNSNLKIIAGGPNINVNIDKDFFKKYDFIDYAIYGPGEQAFHDLIEYLLGFKKKLVKEFASNLAWRENDIVHVAPYKYVKMMEVSPFLHNRKFFIEMVQLEKKRHMGSVLVPYDLTRGCPYACTFCDWNSGLSNKVSRRKKTYKDEIDLFVKAQVDVIYLSDANVGQYDEDVEVVEYIAEKNSTKEANFTVFGNFSKLKKENNLKIYHAFAKGRMVTGGFTFSVQDTHEEILKNIDRPDITWQEHVKMIEELTKQYPNIPCQIQLIQGLPGQTVQSWRETLAEVSKYQTILMTFMNEILPASPAAYDEEYQNKFKFTYSQSVRLNGAELYSTPTFYTGNFSESCFSFSKQDFIKMTILNHFYTMICNVKYRLRFIDKNWDIENIVDKFLDSCFYERLYKNLETNWNNDKFYYTINIDNNPNLITATQNYEPGLIWMRSKPFRNFISKCTDNKKLKNAIRKYNWETAGYWNILSYE